MQLTTSLADSLCLCAAGVAAKGYRRLQLSFVYLADLSRISKPHMTAICLLPYQLDKKRWSQHLPYLLFETVETLYIDI